MIFLLLILFEIKHFVADYILQTPYMLGKFRDDWGFVLPLLSHCLVNSAFTLAIILFVSPGFWWLALVDLVSHFFIDRVKSGSKYLGRYKCLSGNEIKNSIGVLKMAADYKNNTNIYEVGYDSYAKELETKAITEIKGNKYFWWSLGLDQMLHHFVYFFIVYLVAIQ